MSGQPDETLRFGVPAAPRNAPPGPPGPPGPFPPTPPPPPHSSPLPPPRPARRNSAAQLVANLISGILLFSYGTAVAGWVLRGFWDSDTEVGDFVQALFNSKVEISPQFMTPYEWVFAIVLMLVGILTMAQTRVGRGGALVSAWLLVGLSLREIVGSFDETYREGYFNLELGEVVLATRVTGLITAVTILVLLMTVGRQRPPAERLPLGDGEPFGGSMGKPADANPALDPDPGPTPNPLGARIAGYVGGGLLLVYAGVSIAWIIRGLHVQKVDLSEYLRTVVDPAYLGGPTQLSAGGPYYQSAIAVALLVIGVLAMFRRPGAFGAAAALLLVEFYLNLRFVVSCTADAQAGEFPLPTWAYYTEDLEGWLYLSSVGLGLAVAVVAPILLHHATRPTRA